MPHVSLESLALGLALLMAAAWVIGDAILKSEPHLWDRFMKPSPPAETHEEEK